MSWSWRFLVRQTCSTMTLYDVLVYWRHIRKNFRGLSFDFQRIPFPKLTMRKGSPLWKSEIIQMNNILQTCALSWVYSGSLLFEKFSVFPPENVFYCLSFCSLKIYQKLHINDVLLQTCKKVEVWHFWKCTYMVFYYS